MDIYPLSENLVLAVAGALEEADFKSGSSYIGELKLKHIELDSDTLKCAPCAVRRQLQRVNMKFEAPMPKHVEDNRPLFPSLYGSRLSKPQLLKEWESLTACSELSPSGHSPRRSGAKRYARQGLSLWQIQFLGRWAASTVVQYVGEALEDVTAGRSRSIDSSCLQVHHASLEKASSSTTPRAAIANMADHLGTMGTVAQLSGRIDQMEQLLARPGRSQ